MLTQIEFFVNREELINALRFLSSFVAPPRKDDDEYDDEDSEIRLPEPYFYDKVTFSIYNNKSTANLSVLTKEGVKVQRTIDVTSNVDNVSFCMPHAYLLQEVVKYSAESYSFKEDRFFGFNVADNVTGKNLFDIDAHSVSKLPSIHPKIEDGLYIHSVEIETETLKKVLKEFPKYTTEYSFEESTNYIWFNINEGICRVIACSGSQLRQEVFPTSVKGTHVFSLLGKFASRILNIVENWTDYPRKFMAYNDTNTYLKLYDFRDGGHWDIIELPLCKTKYPSFQSILEKRNITHQSSVHLKDLQSALRIINTMVFKNDFVLMHFFPDHVNLYNEDTIYDNTVFHFIDADSVEGECKIKLHQKTLEAILNEVYSDKICFTLVDDNLLYINNEDEPLFGDIIRIQGTAKLQEEDLKLLERGDNSLNSHEGYIEKYITKHDDENDSPEEEYSIIDEMKAEALFRMKEVIDYTPIIDYFEETGLPQVYEPPFGASYSLEEDELEKVREIEDSRNILVWGVVRCFMKYNGQEVTVDCLLHVSQDKDEWEQEREDLRNGIPFVYTVMKEFPLIDHGHINVYKSKGGTLLRG